MSQTTNAVIAELMDRRLLNDVDDDLHQEIAEAVIQAARLSRPDTAESRLREALDITRNALVVMRARLRTEPTVQGRGWVDLGIVVNDAIEEADKALSPPSGGDEAKESVGLNWTLSDDAKKHLDEIEKCIVRHGDPRLNQIVGDPSEPSPPADRREIGARAACKAKGVNPDCLHQNYGDEPIDHTDAQGRTFHYGWRNQLHVVDAILAALDGGR